MNICFRNISGKLDKCMIAYISGDTIGCNMCGQEFKSIKIKYLKPTNNTTFTYNNKNNLDNELLNSKNITMDTVISSSNV